MTKLTGEDIETMTTLRERGWSCASIGKRLGVSAGAVNYRCLALGVTSPNQKGRTRYDGPQSFIGRDGRTFTRFSQADDGMLQELAACGLKLDAIAASMGRARTSVRMRLLLLGANEEIAA